MRLFVRLLAVLLCFATPQINAGPVPKNLGNGLDAIYRQHLENQGGLVAQDRPISRTQRQVIADEYLAQAVTDSEGRIMVSVYLTGDVGLANVVADLVTSGRMQVVAQNAGYRKGLVEGWVRVSDVGAIATQRGVKSVILVPLPETNVGLVTQQGVAGHRVDQLAPGFDGTGITIGVISDSYNTSNAQAIKAPQDVLTGDLPGPGNPNGNTLPVVIIQDGASPTTNTDEGRGMAQLIHDMAPKARLGFATAGSSPQQFADNIRSLAGLPGAPRAVPGFNADIIVDDVIFLTEPMFSDGVVTQGVNDVTAAGKHYFSSAGNRPSTNAYAATFNPVSPADPSVASMISALNAVGVPPSWYAGGFHNFRTDGGTAPSQMIARTVGSGAVAARMVFQWDDPFDKIEPGTQSFQQSGNIASAAGSQDFLVSMTAGTPMRVTVAADASNFDAVVTVTDPSSNIVIDRFDTGTDETVFFTPAATGQYKITVQPFNAATTGAFIVRAFENSTQGITTDYNVFFFDPITGAFAGGVFADNFVTNQPVEFATSIPFRNGATTPTVIQGQGTLRMIITRAAGPVPPTANRLRYVFFDANASGVVPIEYTQYDFPVTYGHSTSRDGHGVAAYSVFRPRIPEGFTSPGPVLITHDASGNRLAVPEIRQQPVIAAHDGGNTTFFSGDTGSDPDTAPNFFGTSAAAPNAAAVAALVLQAKGGPGSVSVADMKKILINSAFPHDLDPYAATATIPTPGGGTLTLTVRADPSNSSAALNGGATTSTSAPFVGPIDFKIVNVSYSGPGSIATLQLDSQLANATGGNLNTVIPGLVFDTRAASAGGQPFALGTLVGLTSGDITPSFTNAPPAPSVVGQFQTMNLAFAPGAFTTAKSFSFNIDRDEQTTSSVTAPATAGGNSADLWGAQYELPSGQMVQGGMRISGTMGDGTPFSGIFRNQVGSGYSPLDGYGLINAQRAVALTAGTARLTINVVGTSAGSVSAGPLSCPGTCEGDATVGVPLVLTATPTAGGSFVGWSGCPSPAGPTCTLTPDKPTTVTATFTGLADAPFLTIVRGNGQITVTPGTMYDGGSPVTGFSVTCNGITQSSTGGALVFSGLTNGTTQNCTATATTVAGTTPVSATFNGTPSIAADAPTIGTATASVGSINPFTANATVSFTPPAINGGGAILYYQVTSTPGSLIATGTSSPVTVFGLTHGTTYTFTVRAVNAAGAGVASAASNSVTPVTIAGTPTAVVGTPGNGQVSVAFTVNNGGSPITNVTVASFIGGVATGINASGTTSPIVVTGLTNGTAYTFRVTATNAIGTGLQSAPSAAVTPVSVPDAPVIGSATAGNTTATVSFTPPANNGGVTISGYTVTSNPGAITKTGAASPITVTGLTNGTAYTFTVTATNTVGTSAPSAASNSVTPSAGPKPYDFGGDGKPDLIWSNTSNGATYLWNMNGPVLSSDAFITQIDPAWTIQGVADFDGDGKPDLVWRNTDTGNTFVWYMNGTSLISDAFLFSLPPEWVIQGVADFNGDGKPDFLLRNTTTGVGFVWFFNNATPVSDQFLFSIDPVWKVEALADVNGDGQPDLMFRNMSSGLGFVWNTAFSGGNLSLGTSAPPSFGIDPIWEIAQWADYNGDGTPDLVFRNATTGLVFVWYMTGTTLTTSDFITQIDTPWVLVPRR